MNDMGYILEAFLAVNLLVLAHELGHMLAGRLFGIPSLRLSIGLGRRLAGVKYKGTDYYLAPIPLGGFVELQHGHRHDSATKCTDCVSAWKRIVVYAAGPAANLVMVLLLLWLATFGVGFQDRLPVVGAVAPDSWAAQAGIEPGDRILQINDRPVVSWTHFLAISQISGGAEMALALGKAADARTAAGGAGVLHMKLPAEAVQGLEPTEELMRLRLGPFQALKASLEDLWKLSHVAGKSVMGLVTARVPPSELVGPVYLFHISATAAEQSQAGLLYLLAVISASLCFFNLLPAPILDGGQIALALLQKVLRRPLQPKSIRLLSVASFVWLLLLLASATLNDLVRLFIT